MQSDVVLSEELCIVGGTNASVRLSTSSALCLVDSYGNNESHLKQKKERIQVCLIAHTMSVQRPLAYTDVPFSPIPATTGSRHTKHSD